MSHRLFSSRLLGACVLAAASAVLAAPSAATAGPVLDRIKSSGVITFGYRASGPPFSYEAADGRVVGYAIDVCQQVAAAIQQRLGLPKLETRFVPVTPAERIDKLNSGAIDLECAGSTNTKTRREQVAFGLTYYYTSARLLVRQSDGIDALEDMTGKRLAVVKGTTAQQVLDARQRRGIGGWLPQVFDSTRAAIAALEQGQVDAVIQDDIQLAPAARQSGGKLVVVGPAMSFEPLSLMLSKTDPELQQQVQADMARLYRDGRMERIYERWFEAPLPDLSYALDIKLDRLLRDNFRRPSPYVPDWAVL